MKLLASLLIIGSVASATPALAQEYPYRSVFNMDALHQSLFGKTVTARVIDRSIEPLVSNVQTDHLSKPMVRFEASYEANMCALEQLHCTAARYYSGKSTAECIQFTQTFKNKCEVGGLKPMQ